MKRERLKFRRGCEQHRESGSYLSISIAMHGLLTIILSDVLLLERLTLWIMTIVSNLVVISIIVLSWWVVRGLLVIVVGPVFFVAWKIF
jgi:hypothetical protein